MSINKCQLSGQLTDEENDRARLARFERATCGFEVIGLLSVKRATTRRYGSLLVPAFHFSFQFFGEGVSDLLHLLAHGFRSGFDVAGRHYDGRVSHPLLEGHKINSMFDAHGRKRVSKVMETGVLEFCASARRSEATLY